MFAVGHPNDGLVQRNAANFDRKVEKKLTTLAIIDPDRLVQPSGGGEETSVG